MYICQSQSPNSSSRPPFPFGNHKFVLYICDSISAFTNHNCMPHLSSCVELITGKQEVAFRLNAVYPMPLPWRIPKFCCEQCCETRICINSFSYWTVKQCVLTKYLLIKKGFADCSRKYKDGEERAHIVGGKSCQQKPEDNILHIFKKIIKIKANF